MLDFFCMNYRPGVIGLVGTTDMLGRAIRRFQRSLGQDGKPSWWSHCFVMGEWRLDRRGVEGAIARSLYIFESAIDFDRRGRFIHGGAQESWIGKWCRAENDHAAIIDWDLTLTERDTVFATALQLADEHVTYPLQELIGTWLAIIRKRQALENPFDDPHAMYCSSFIRHCYRAAGRDFLSDKISESNTTPEHIAAAGARAYRLKLFR